VVGLEHAELGQQVAALVVLAAPRGGGGDGGDGDAKAAEEEIAAWCAARLPPYAAPRVTKVLRAPLPRNAMGKIAKKELARQFFGAAAAPPPSSPPSS
jgi:acyl-coenzyme A synthetase/AMP-(fatty) acid ligase